MSNPLTLGNGTRVDVVPPAPPDHVVVPVVGPRGPKGDPGDADDLAAIADLVGDVVDTHVQAPEPHPAYDDMPSLVLLFENGLI